MFTYRGNPVRKLRTSAWIRAWTKAGLPTDSTLLKGVHNLRHTFGRRLRGAGVPQETRKALLGHASGDITTHYSAAELGELLDAAEKVTDRGRAQSPTLTVIKRQKEESVGKLSEMRGKVSGITEGFHNKMEMMSRRAYGFRNFENYRLRVLTHCGWDGIINRV